MTFEEMTESHRINSLRLMAVHVGATEGRDSVAFKLMEWAVDRIDRSSNAPRLCGYCGLFHTPERCV